MKKWVIALKHGSFCELCNERHLFIKCPNCNYGIADLHEFSMGHSIVCGKCESEFATWCPDQSTATLVECEHVFRRRFGKIDCREPKRFELAMMGDEDYDLTCQKDQCPLVELVQT